METYQKSERHLANLHKGSLIRAQQQKEQKRKRVEEYYQSPMECLLCKSPIKYENKVKSKYCSRSCSASHTQKGVKRSAETCENIRKALVGKPSPFKGMTYVQTHVNVPASCKINYKNCTGCGKVFVTANMKKNFDRKTCSHICNIQASLGVRAYQNGRKKIAWFENPWQGKVLLESSWEVEIATLLTEKNIKWLRPPPIPWVDDKRKTRHYFPDFYLPEQNMYLDPKNPWGMDRDKAKMAAVEKLIPILYGDKEMLIKYISTLK